ncbi:MAG: 5-(carboxyamino)imidazole ribonucleotide synthase [Rhodocyclaceae bacterium]
MILPPAMLGVLGGGQLGRYFVNAAHQLGYRVMVLDPDPCSTAGRIADVHLKAAYDDPAALECMSSMCAAVTVEFESVPADALAYLERSTQVRPGADAVAICQDRRREKGFLKRFGFPHAPYAEILCNEDIVQTSPDLFPAILKVSRFGYDGKGQARVASRAEALAAFNGFNGEACVLEQLMPLDYEASLVLARGEDGALQCFPMAENHHQGGILDYSIAPSHEDAAAIFGEARQIAEGIATELKYVGVLGIEFFISNGRLYVNELAPRPHNSAHYTLDACLTSQFEQQVRALCGLPLAAPDMHSAAVMVNLLGDLWFVDGGDEPREPDWQHLLRQPELKLHLYGKESVQKGRKMGHFAVLAKDRKNAFAIALESRAAMACCRERSDFT